MMQHSIPSFTAAAHGSPPRVLGRLLVRLDDQRVRA